MIMDCAKAASADNSASRTARAWRNDGIRRNERVVEEELVEEEVVEEEHVLIRALQASRMSKTRVAHHRRKGCGRYKQLTSRTAAHRNTGDLQTTSNLRLQPRT
jgi:hypothetical protein